MHIGVGYLESEPLPQQVYLTFLPRERFETGSLICDFFFYIFLSFLQVIDTWLIEK